MLYTSYNTCLFFFPCSRRKWVFFCEGLEECVCHQKIKRKKFGIFSHRIVCKSNPRYSMIYIYHNFLPLSENFNVYYYVIAFFSLNTHTMSPSLLFEDAFFSTQKENTVAKFTKNSHEHLDFPLILLQYPMLKLMCNLFGVIIGYHRCAGILEAVWWIAFFFASFSFLFSKKNVFVASCCESTNHLSCNIMHINKILDRSGTEKECRQKAATTTRTGTDSVISFRIKCVWYRKS